MNYDEVALQSVRERRLLIDRCDAWLFDMIEPFIGRRVLEVGCGVGNLLAHLRNREFVLGIDTSASSVEHVKTQFQNCTNIQAITCDVTDSSFMEFKAHRFDTIISLNVFEHIDNDVLAIRQSREVLTQEGKFILIVPAHQWLYGPMDRSIGHYRRYSIQDLQSKMNQAGLQVIEQRYINPLGALGWFTSGRLLGRKIPPVGQLNLFNRMMPLVRLIDKIKSIPFGLSVLSISERLP